MRKRILSFVLSVAGRDGPTLKAIYLRVLDNAHLSRPQYASVKSKSFLLGVEASTVLLVGLRCLKDGLMDIRVKLLRLFRGVESLETMLLQGIDENGICHLDTVVQGNEIGVV